MVPSFLSSSDVYNIVLIYPDLCSISSITAIGVISSARGVTPLTEESWTLPRQPAIGSPLASLVVLDGKLVEVLNNEALVMVDALDHLDELLQLRGGGLAGGR